MPREGIDVASHQHPGGAPIHWDEVAAAGIDWVSVKLTQVNAGGTYVNPYAHGDVTGALAAGLEVSVYHYAQPQVSYALVEAAIFAAEAAKLPPEVGLVLDLEEGSSLGWGTLATWADHFLASCPCRFIYWNRNYRSNLAAFVAGWGVQEWVAAPGRSCPTGARVWQRGQGPVPGIVGDVDLNTVYYERGDVPSPIEEDEDMGTAPTDVVATYDRPGGRPSVDRWLLQRDGGVITEGDAPFYGSYPGLPAEDRQDAAPFVAIGRHVTDDGWNADRAGEGIEGYALTNRLGHVFRFPLAPPAE